MSEEYVRKQLLTLDDKNIFIMAGAGAGKSSLMIDRMMAQAISGKQPFHQTVAITFTNKAKAELEEKLFERINHLPDTAEKKALIQARNELTIETIHSFCQRILSERPIEAGLNPQFAVIESKDQAPLLRKILLDIYYDREVLPASIYEPITEAGIKIEQLFAMLYEKVAHRELGLNLARESSFSEADRQAQKQQLIKNIEQAILPYGKPINIGSVHKVLKLPFKAVGAKHRHLPLNQYMDVLWEDYKDLEKVVEKLFNKAGQKKLLAAMPGIAEMEEQMKANEGTCGEQLIPHIQTMFAEALSKVWQADIITLPDLFHTPEAIALAEANPSWQAELERIIQGGLSQSEKAAQLFAHIFAKPLQAGQVTSFMTGPKQKIFQACSETDLDRKLAVLIDASTFSKDLVKDGLQDVITHYKTLSTTHSQALYALNEAVQALFAMVIEKYEQEKAARNVVTQNDLLKKTYDLLQHEEARVYFKKKYRYLYVDECQDTDPLQTKIIFYLTSANQPASIEEAKPVPGSLFLVGDPKQSIYRFRQADLRIYDQVHKIARESEDWFVADLKNNYRSRPKLIQWFNQAFPNQFKREKDPKIQPPYDKMTAYKPCTKQEPVYTLSAEGDDQQIARWILAEKRKNPSFKYKDVMIITPYTRHVEKYVKTLNAYGIPTLFSGKMTASEVPEIVKLTDIIQYIARPDRFQKAKVLLQNWYIPMSLLQEAEAKERATGTVLADFTEEKFASLQLAEETLAYYRQLASYQTPIDFLKTLVEEQQFGVFAMETTETSYQAARTILQTFIEKISVLQPRTINELAAVMKEQIAEPIEHELPMDNQQNEVRIMNLHKTKGLQARFVFLVNPAPITERMPLSITTRDGWEEEVLSVLYTKTVREVIHYVPAAYEAALEKEKRRQEAERLRELYVAATRAEDMLVISTNEKEEETWSDLLTDNLPPLPIEEVDVPGLAKQYIPVPDRLSYQQLKEKAQEERNRILQASSYQKVNPSDDSQFAIELEEIILDNHPNKLEPELSVAYKGPLWGNIIHAGIEYVLAHGNKQLEQKQLNDILSKGLAQYDLTDHELTQLGNYHMDASTRHERLAILLADTALQQSMIKVIQAFIEHEHLQALQAAYTAVMEVPFTAWVEDKTGKLSMNPNEATKETAVYINGIIDLVFQHKIDKEKLVIVDYKTDQIRTGERVALFHQRLVSTYQQQLTLYKTVMEEVFHFEVEATYIYAVRTNQFLRL